MDGFIFVKFSKYYLWYLLVLILFAIESCGEPKNEIKIGLTRGELDSYLEVNGYVKKEEIKEFLNWEQIIAALGDPKSNLYKEIMLLVERYNARTVTTIENLFKNPESNASKDIKALLKLTDSNVKELKEILELHKFIAQLRKLSDPSSTAAKTLDDFLTELGPGKGRLLGLFGNILQGEDDAIGVANLNVATLDKLWFLTAIFARCLTYANQETAIKLLFENEIANLVGAVHGIDPINKNSVHEAFCKKEGVVSSTGPTLDKIFVYNNTIYQCSLTGPAGTAKMKQLKADGAGFDTEVVLGGV